MPMLTVAFWYVWIVFDYPKLLQMYLFIIANIVRVKLSLALLDIPMLSKSQKDPISFSMRKGIIMWEASMMVLITIRPPIEFHLYSSLPS